ncbi:MAG: hypothetical protein LBL96_10775 [Clostridiales bacterium]|jgi:hypothetical protein|nr:hypothetical protein [Clostridiales bacterium]
MAYYYQTLRDIPMAFKRYRHADLAVGDTTAQNVKSADMLFILFLFFMVRDEPYFA